LRQLVEILDDFAEQSGWRRRRRGSVRQSTRGLHGDLMEDVRSKTQQQNKTPGEFTRGISTLHHSCFLEFGSCLTVTSLHTVYAFKPIASFLISVELSPLHAIIIQQYHRT
jgi:hypothetical protein